MTLEPAVEQSRALRLLEHLPPEQVSAVVQLLETMVDPVARSLANAPYDDEELTPEDVDEIERADASLDASEGIPHEEIMREFGLTPSS